MKRILYVQYTNPAGYPPLEHSSKILADEGWDILFLGTGAYGADVLEFPPHPKIQVHRLRFCPAGWRQKLHYIGFGLWVTLWVLYWRPQWIYASDQLSCPIALVLSFFPGLRVIYQEHDSPNVGVRSQESGVRSRRSEMGGFLRFVLWARRKLAHRASLCVLPNEQRVEKFTQETGTTRPVVCVWNCPSRDDVNTQPKAEKKDQFVVFYHGSIVPVRLPETVLDALTTLPEQVVLRVAGYETVGHLGYVGNLKQRGERLGIGSRLEILGALPQRRQLLERCLEATIGLAFMPMNAEDVNQQAMAGASNKPFDYLACGLALLVSDLPDWRRMFVEPGYGRACNPDDPDSIAEALHWFLEHPEETRQMGDRGRERILREWNYETQFAEVYSRLCHF